VHPGSLPKPPTIAQAQPILNMMQLCVGGLSHVPAVCLLFLVQELHNTLQESPEGSQEVKRSHGFGHHHLDIPVTNMQLY
jgi:hypothetical protein